MATKTSGNKSKKASRAKAAKRGGGCEISTITFDLDLTKEQELKFRKLCSLHKLKFPEELSLLLEKVAQPLIAKKSATVSIAKPNKVKAKAKAKAKA